MTNFVTARADITFFGKTEEKEDIVPIDLSITDNTCSFSLKKTEFALRLIEKSHVFAVNIIHATERQTDLCRVTEGAFSNKFAIVGFVKKECRTIDCPSIGGAEVYECQLLKKEETENEVKITGTVLMKKN